MVLVPSRLFRVLLFAVGFQRGIDLLSQRLHLTWVWQAFGVWNRRCITKLSFGVGTVLCSSTSSQKNNAAAKTPLKEQTNILTLFFSQLNLVLWKRLLRASNWKMRAVPPPPYIKWREQKRGLSSENEQCTGLFLINEWETLSCQWWCVWGGGGRPVIRKSKETDRKLLDMGSGKHHRQFEFAYNIDFKN